MKRRAVGVVAVAVGVAASLVAAGGAPAVAQPGHQVLATGLDNPRQLNWSEDGKTLLIAEAGSGGATCVGAGENAICAGFTGSVGAIHYPWNKIRVAPEVVATGLFSAAGPDGSFATGPDGADFTDTPGEVLTAMTGIPPEEVPPELATLPGAAEQVGRLIVSQDVMNYPYLDFFPYEESRNPDNAQIESNPYAVLFVRSKAGDASGYALIADAAANAVWKVDPDFDACQDENCVPPADVTVFAKWNVGKISDEDIEYVPTSLAEDRAGNIYVGGLGSLAPGQAKVTKLSRTGKKLQVWKGFTSVTGVAVDRKNRLYVSQLFGGAQGDPFAPDAPPAGLVTRVKPNGNMWSKPVPFPAGVAVDPYLNVYVAAWSVLPSGFRPGNSERPTEPGGEVWRIRY